MRSGSTIETITVRRSRNSILNSARQMAPMTAADLWNVACSRAVVRPSTFTACVPGEVYEDVFEIPVASSGPEPLE